MPLPQQTVTRNHDVGQAVPATRPRGGGEDEAGGGVGARGQGQWWLRQRFDAAAGTPLHATVHPSSYNVGLITAEGRVEKVVFWNGWRKQQVFHVRYESLAQSKLEFFRTGIAIHMESPVPHDVVVVFGAAPTQGVELSESRLINNPNKATTTVSIQ